MEVHVGVQVRVPLTPYLVHSVDTADDRHSVMRSDWPCPGSKDSVPLRTGGGSLVPQLGVTRNMMTTKYRSGMCLVWTSSSDWHYSSPA